MTNSKKRKKNHYLIKFLILICITVIGFILIINLDQKNINSHTTSISRDKITDIRMQKAVDKDLINGKMVNFVDVELDDDNIQDLIKNLNNEDLRESVNKVPPEIKIGILINLEHNKKIRVQYSRGSVFVTHIDENGMEIYKQTDSTFVQFFQQWL
jgi:hypothetical protein